MVMIMVIIFVSSIKVADRRVCPPKKHFKTFVYLLNMSKKHEAFDEFETLLDPSGGVKGLIQLRMVLA